MKINIEFEGWGELCDFLAQATATPMAQLRTSFETGDKVVEEAVQASKEEKAKKSTPKKEKAQEEPKTEASEVPFEEEKGGIVPQKAAPAKEEAPDVSKLQVEVRKMLAQVNKKTGTNTASQWIKELTSVEKLTEVQSADELMALKAKAEEVLNG